MREQHCHWGIPHQVAWSISQDLCWQVLNKQYDVIISFKILLGWVLLERVPKSRMCTEVISLAMMLRSTGKGVGRLIRKLETSII